MRSFKIWLVYNGTNWSPWVEINVTNLSGDKLVAYVDVHSHRNP